MAEYIKTSPIVQQRSNQRNSNLETLNYREIPNVQDDVTYSIAPNMPQDQIY